MASCPPELVPTFPIGRVERIARLRSTIAPRPGPKLPFLDPDAGAVRHARVDGRAQARLPEKQVSLRYWDTYPSARLVRFNFSAISTSRRSASEREGLSGWRLAQASTSAVNAGGARKASIGSLPVPGRPRFLGITFLLDTLAIARYYLKFAGR